MKIDQVAQVVGLNRRTLRQIERDLGVYLDDPKAPNRCSNQHFGVYDEDEVHTGDVQAVGRWFTESELKQKIAALFKRKLENSSE